MEDGAFLKSPSTSAAKGNAAMLFCLLSSRNVLWAAQLHLAFLQDEGGADHD